jgi:hypothetical protein
MINFTIGLIVGPIILCGVYIIYLHYAGKRSDAALRGRIKKYTHRNDEAYLGEYPNIPKGDHSEKKN